MQAEELLETLTDDELKRRANRCFIQAENTNLYQQPGPAERQRFLTEADFYLKALTWRQEARTAERDRKRNEELAQRDFNMEVGVMVLIGFEIVLSVVGLWMGYQQGKVLDKQTSALTHMDTSTAATADSLQKLVAAQDASLKILQEEQAQRAKKPRLALYVGSMPIDKATVRLAGRPEYAQVTASFDLLVKNVGDAPLSTSRFHALLPEEIRLDVERLITVPEFEAPARPRTQRVTLQLPLLPVGDTVRLHMVISAPKGHPAFKIPFTLDASELQAVASLGSLAVLPPKP